MAVRVLYLPAVYCSRCCRAQVQGKQVGWSALGAGQFCGSAGAHAGPLQDLNKRLQHKSSGRMGSCALDGCAPAVT